MVAMKALRKADSMAEWLVSSTAEKTEWHSVENSAALRAGNWVSMKAATTAVWKADCLEVNLADLKDAQRAACLAVLWGVSSVAKSAVSRAGQMAASKVSMLAGAKAVMTVVWMVVPTAVAMAALKVDCWVGRWALLRAVSTESRKAVRTEHRSAGR
jgi:hypothetical protein